MPFQYYNRYNNLIVNGSQINIPYVTLPPKSTDKMYIYRVGVSRLDKVSQTYYGSPYFGWLILQANPEYGGSEVNIPNDTTLKIPFPLTASLLDYKTALQTHFYYYGK
jgi:hypothetical protein